MFHFPSQEQLQARVRCISTDWGIVSLPGKPWDGDGVGDRARSGKVLCQSVEKRLEGPLIRRPLNGGIWTGNAVVCEPGRPEGK